MKHTFRRARSKRLQTGRRGGWVGVCVGWGGGGGGNDKPQQG